MPMMTLFRSLLPKKNRTSPEGLVSAYLDQLGLTREQALTLRSLAAEPGWRALLTALDSIIHLRSEEMLRISDDSNLHFYRGRLTGLREVPNLVDEILARLNSLEETDARQQHNAALRDDPRVVATFGTPAWTDRTTR
jgi:hypothetical protein